jgi:hypothetical protein
MVIMQPAAENPIVEPPRCYPNHLARPLFRNAQMVADRVQWPARKAQVERLGATLPLFGASLCGHLLALRERESRVEIFSLPFLHFGFSFGVRGVAMIAA